MTPDQPIPLQSSAPQSIARSPLILTLKLDDSSFDRLNQLRQTYFPRHRNFLPAHVTLFHALPGAQEQDIRDRLRSICAGVNRFPIAFPTLRFLGKGFAAEIEAPPLIHLHHNLAQGWRDWLTPQDQQKYKPHVTIQNKVQPDLARQDFQQLASQWQPLQGYGEGLLLWHYKGGPWDLAELFCFSSTPLNTR